ncbi:MAG: DUF1573 domain-containing protein [Bacteroidota bacterium]|nr:DUF1573 domain-containing protein [Bacteroidota bacterium]
MKKYSLLLFCLVCSLAAMSQKAVISFEEKSHDFGKIKEEDGKVTHVFDFTNRGNFPLVVSRVQASCGCTTPTWSKEPIEPGRKGSITVTYNPTGRPGTFTKSITVYSNASDEQFVLTIHGEVLPKETGENSFPVVMGALHAKYKVVQMNNVDKGRTQSRVLDIKNTSNTPLKPTVENLPNYLSVTITPEILKPNEEGKLIFTFNSKNCAQWGPVSDEAYVILNGQKKYSEEYKLTIVSNIIEDFSKLTLDQKRKAPILEIPVRFLNLGTLKEGKRRVGKFRVNNKGQNSLEVRRIINNNKELAVHPARLTVSGGKSSQIIVDLNTKNLSEGDYKKSITVQTNDPENSFLILVLNWKVQR